MGPDWTIRTSIDPAGRVDRRTCYGPYRAELRPVNGDIRGMTEVVR